MGKKAKTGKQRKDKFYHLAKESGYRARSAFKLIQLNRKFGFLQESRVLIDLCAAPGGWLQVAANNMPVSSIVIGVDLVPIKTIPNVTTFQADITTDHCKELLKKELKTWKADVILNDGAPNVGTAWVQDAFSQAQLALSALKLASEHLKKGGWFITKLFRSKDYTALLWVFEQLFKKVHSTKPQASRNESAEIFVVCQGYLAPDKLDEKFLNPKHVFNEIEQESKVRLDVLRPEKQKRQREGYPENNVSLHNTVTAKQFMETPDAVDFLSTANKIDIIQDDIKQHPATTTEVIQCCQDIKVLGRKEIKTLFLWRKKLRKDFKDDGQTELDVLDDTKKDTEKSEEEKQEELDQIITELKTQENKDVKRKKKRVREVKKKMRERLANKLDVASEDAGIQEQDLFALNLMKDKKDLEMVDENEPEDMCEDAVDSDLENLSESDSDNESEDSDTYVYGDDELYEKLPKKKEQSDEPQMKKRKKSAKSENPLLVNMEEDEGDDNVAAVKKAKQWYQKDIFKDVEEKDSDLDDDYDVEQMLLNFKKKGGKVIGKIPEDTENTEKGTEQEEDDVDDADEDEDDVEDDSDYESEVDDRSISQGQRKEEKTAMPTKETKKGFETVPIGKDYLEPEDLAIGTAMATSKKRKRDIIDGAYNRYSFNDENLPSWFTEDENKHTFRQVPVTREEVEYYKQRMRELNARPIKKVIEAKAKKKSKMLHKLDKVRKKAQGILDSTETSMKEQQHQIKGIYKRAGLLNKKREKPTFVVAKKGLAGKKYSRPDGVKGTYKVVDPRLKKDLRAMKNKEKTKGRKRKR